MEDLNVKIKDGGLWIEDRHSRFEDFNPAKPTFDIHISVYHLSEITLFEDIVKL